MQLQDAILAEAIGDSAFAGMPSALVDRLFTNANMQRVPADTLIVDPAQNNPFLVFVVSGLLSGFGESNFFSSDFLASDFLDPSFLSRLLVLSSWFASLTLAVDVGGFTSLLLVSKPSDRFSVVGFSVDVSGGSIVAR